jgi:Flp pilus assembly protein TadD
MFSMLRRGLVALGLALCAASVPAADEPSAPSSVDLTQARAAIARKDWNAAIAELQRLARRDAKNADVQNLLGYSYRNAGQVDKAFAAYDNALRLDPNHKGAHEYIGIAYLLAKNPDKAREHLARLKVLCGGETCEEYQDLAKAIAAYTP